MPTEKLSVPTSETVFPSKLAWLWAGLEVSVIVLVTGFLFISIFHTIGFFIWVLSSIVTLFYNIYFLSKTNLTVTSDGITGQVKQKSVNIRWQDLIACRISARGDKIFLASASEYFEIGLAPFNANGAWRVVEKYAPSSILAENAYKRLPDYREQEQEFQAKVLLYQSFEGKLYGRYQWWLQIIPCVGFIILGVYSLYQTFTQGLSLFDVAGLIMPLSFCAFTAFKFTQWAEIDKEKVSIVNWLGKQTISWSEVTKIRHDRNIVGTVTLQSQNKTLIVVGINYWLRSNREQFVDFLRVKARANGIKEEWAALDTA
jgi:hypothetical protein